MGVESRVLCQAEGASAKKRRREYSSVTYEKLAGRIRELYEKFPVKEAEERQVTLPTAELAPQMQSWGAGEMKEELQKRYTVEKRRTPPVVKKGDVVNLMQETC